MARLRPATALLILVTLPLFAGCGGDDNTGSSSERSQELASLVAPERPGSPAIQRDIPVFAGDPKATKKPRGERVLEKLPRVRVSSSEAAAAPRIRGSEGKTVAQWLHEIDGDVASFWQRGFNAAGYNYSSFPEVIYSDAFDSKACGRVEVEAAAFYCPPPADSIFFSLPWLVDNIEPIGDTALALVVAHEQGHRVQSLLGLEFPRTFEAEQQADCLAGYWAADVYRRGLIEPDDFSEFARLSTVIADRPGVPLDDPGAHGTAEQRREAFEKGYNTGNAGDCSGYASNAA